MRTYIKNGTAILLVVFVGLAAFYIPLRVHSIDPKEAIEQAFEESLQFSHTFMASVAGSTKSSLKNGPLNIFSLEPLQYLQFKAPVFNPLPLFPTKNPVNRPQKNTKTDTQNNTLSNSLNQTSAPTITMKETRAEDALINIFCSQITGSGVLIHRDGTVLTNAHVAQFPLLSESNPNVVCLARFGNPASGSIGMKVSFISPEWIKEYGKHINTEGAPQTGSSDFALLKLNLSSLNKTQKDQLSPITVQKTLPNQGDSIYSLSYPADILGTRGVNSSLPQQKELLSVNRIYSVGVTPTDVIETTASTAGQRGSSGGAILNEQGQLIGTITTIVNSNTPSKKLIRAMTIGHTDFELTKFSNINLDQVTNYGGDTVQQVFNTKYKEYLTSLLSNYLK
jgi:Trypsin-like peptidase domain